MDYREDAKMDTEREYNLEKEYNADGNNNKQINRWIK